MTNDEWLVPRPIQISCSFARTALPGICEGRTIWHGLHGRDPNLPQLGTLVRFLSTVCMTLRQFVNDK